MKKIVLIPVSILALPLMAAAWVLGHVWGILLGAFRMGVQEKL